jgi:hypothetical protein
MPAKKSTKSVRARPPRRPRTCPTRHSRTALRRLITDLTIALAAVTTAAVVLLLGDGTAAHAAVPGPVLAADSVEAVVNNIRTWLFALLGAVATLFLTVGGLRLMWANGDPGEVEKGKAALKSAAIGYALALLSPLIVTVVAGWVK